MGSSGWVMQAKIEIYLWLGIRDPKKRIKEYIEGLPKGYEMTEEQLADPLPPKYLLYPGKLLLHPFSFVFIFCCNNPHQVTCIYIRKVRSHC